VRTYLAFLRGSIMVGMIYRLGFFFIVLGNVVYMFVAYYLWRSIYGENQILNGLTFDQAFLYIALGSTVFILLKTYTDWGMNYEIRDGTISVYLTKPIDYQWYTLFTNLGFTLTSLGTVTLPTILLLVFVFQVYIPLGIGFLFFPISLVMAFLISFHFDYMIGLMAFYTESIWGISTTKEIVITVFSGALLPLQFFPAALQQILLWLPFQAIYYTPLMMVTRPNQPVETLLGMLGVQLAWAVITFLLCRVMYHQAVKVLRIAGG